MLLLTLVTGQMNNLLRLFFACENVISYIKQRNYISRVFFTILPNQKYVYFC